MIDWGQVQAEIHRRAERALLKATEHALGRAKHHAPVRAIFKRTRRGPEFTRKGGITTATQYRAFMRSKERRRVLDILSAPRGAESLVTAGQAEQMGGIRREGRQYGRTTSFSGHPNSLIPVFSAGSGSQRFVFTGDLRRRDVTGPGPGIRQRRGVDASDIGRPKVLSAERSIQTREARFSARGRYEFQNARRFRSGVSPSGKAFALPPLFQGRVGGRLRGEIHMIPPRWLGTTMWAYVESPTPYARYQEFGSSHNRAQPYLRPALYESRKVLIAEVRKELA